MKRSLLLSLPLSLAIACTAAAQPLPPWFRWRSLPGPTMPPVAMQQADPPGWPSPMAAILRPRVSGPGTVVYYNPYTNRVEQCYWDGAYFHTLNGMIYP